MSIVAAQASYAQSDRKQTECENHILGEIIQQDSSSTQQLLLQKQAKQTGSAIPQACAKGANGLPIDLVHITAKHVVQLRASGTEARSQMAENGNGRLMNWAQM